MFASMSVISVGREPGHTVSHGHGKASGGLDAWLFRPFLRGNVHLMDCHDHSHANDLAEMKGVGAPRPSHAFGPFG